MNNIKRKYISTYEKYEYWSTKINNYGRYAEGLILQNELLIIGGIANKPYNAEESMQLKELRTVCLGVGREKAENQKLFDEMMLENTNMEKVQSVTKSLQDKIKSLKTFWEGLPGFLRELQEERLNHSIHRK